MSVADLSDNQRKELAKWLNKFPPATEDNDDPDQYWFNLADHLRKTQRKQFDYTNLVLSSCFIFTVRCIMISLSFHSQYLVTVGEKENPALHLLHDLAVRRLKLVELGKCLEAINCERGLNVFRNASESLLILVYRFQCY